MIVETIESRYSVDPGTLEKYLENKFGKGNFSVIVPDEEEGEKWKVQVPRELTYDEKVEIQRKCREVIKKP